MTRRVQLPLAAAFVVLLPSGLCAQSLRGSRVSVERQNTIAQEHDFSFLRTSSDVRRFVALGLLVPLSGDAHYELAAVSQPYARPAVKTFVERLAAQYFAACGERLVITSLTRPALRQPRNASDQSVHPAGMAVDLRISTSAPCRRWLDRTLLSLEKGGLLDATRERRPAHYHVAVFPNAYLAYVGRLEAARTAMTTTASDRPGTTPLTGPAAGVAEAPDSAGAESAATIDYRIRRGDSLWSIAQKHNTSVALLKQVNGLRSSRITAGQVLVVPVSSQ